MRRKFPVLTAQKVTDYCRVRLAGRLSQSEVDALRAYLHDLLLARAFPPYRGRWVDTAAMSEATGIENARLLAVRSDLQPVCDALCRALADGRNQPPTSSPGDTAQPGNSAVTAGSTPVPTAGKSVERKRSGPKPRPVVAEPDPLWTTWSDPPGFAEALRLHMARHGDTVCSLNRAMATYGEALPTHGLAAWYKGAKAPHTAASLRALSRIEARYRLPQGYFTAKLPRSGRAPSGHSMAPVTPAERRRHAWHLPADFGRRPAAEQEKMLTWVRTVVISGTTDYRRFQAAATKTRYALRFPGMELAAKTGPLAALSATRSSSLADAPKRLQQEMQDLLRFKTATLTTLGLRRNGVWGPKTASQKVEHFSLMFGALAADPEGEVRGFGASRGSLTFALLVFPAVWDWYLGWRGRRRGFYTKWEVDMLSIVLSLVKAETGWLRQSPRLAAHLTPIPGLVSAKEIAAAQADWDAACDALHRHGRSRIREITRVAKVHRDPFEPILPILEAPSPLGEYRKITEEIVRLMPDERLYPRAAAEAVRAFLMLRLGLHLGLRQRNLRELLVCPRGRLPSSERQLADRKRGELRWSTRDEGWEVLIPSVAFKNAHSSFFGGKPFRLVLPDLGDLYAMIEAWIDRHRARVLGPADDPGTFFVKTAKRTSTSAAYDGTKFYEAWRLAIQRYGIRNPYTGRGAIEGLLPHGPHNVRDVLATHILKQTGSYEQASYAIQDTPEMIAQHYGRFLPQDKAAIAAKILNQVWLAA